MADVAFLLLIFFLVTTSVTQLASFNMPLVPQNNQQHLNTPASATLIFYLNKNNEVLAQKSLTPLSAVPDLVKQLVLSHKNKDCYIGINYDALADYATFSNLHSGIRKGVNDARNELSMQEFGLLHHAITQTDQQKISRLMQIHLFEAESSFD